MNASPAVGSWTRRRLARAAWLAAGLAALAAVPAAAQGPIQLSSSPIPENPAWKGYVLGDGALQASPVRIASTSGAVTNAEGLVDPSRGPAKLTWDGTGPAPLILLDYGREVGGLPFLNVGAVTPGSGATSVTLRAAYSETRQFMWSFGNATLSVPAVSGDVNISKSRATSRFTGFGLALRARWTSAPRVRNSGLSVDPVPGGGDGGAGPLAPRARAPRGRGALPAPCVRPLAPVKKSSLLAPLPRAL